LEIKIGVQNTTREITLESDQSMADVAKSVSAAMEEGGAITISDTKGRSVLVPVAALAYIEFGEEEHRKIGFA
jgi:hypothetical protein